MAKPPQTDVVKALLKSHGRTFSEELGFDAGRNTPGPLFKLLCASILLSARIRSEAAMAAAKALFAAGWTTPKALTNAGWEARVKVLNRSGYARYDESTARMLGDTAQLLMDDYRGDLRRLREKADRRPDRERHLLRQFKGLGDVGVDIFWREAQGAWDELYPFADSRSLKAADQLGLPADAAKLAQLVDKADFPQLVAALIRCSLAKDQAAIKAQAASGVT